jgi:hypothetical protein
MTASLLATVTLAPTSGIAHDEAVNTFAFGGTGTWGDLQPGVEAALHTCYNALGTYIAGSMSHTVVTFRYYDITGHENGSPHGSPIVVETTGITASAGNPSMAPGVAVCVSLRSSPSSTRAVAGPVVDTPTPESAQDMGAPATHPAPSRPRARTEGRVFIGPLDQGVDNASIPGGPKVAALSGMRAAIAGMITAGLCIWSRRDASLYSVLECGTQGLYSYQRLRNPRPTARLWTP